MHQATVLAAPAAGVRLRAYQQLTKPGITTFVGLSAAGGYIVSAPAGTLDSATLALVVMATMAMSGGAAASNHIAERHLDMRMRRTRLRPLPTGIISVRAATRFATALTAMGALLAVMTLPLTAFLFLAACHASYVWLYTPLKQKSEWCTVVGAIPGALPVLAGSAAAAANLGVPALALTGVLFAWQMPHFLAIGWLMREDYAAAGFRMRPVTDRRGIRTAATALVYAIAVQACTVLLTRAIGAGALATACAHIAGTAYLLAALAFLHHREKKQARRLFLTSLLVLPVILTAAMASVLTTR